MNKFARSLYTNGKLNIPKALFAAFLINFILIGSIIGIAFALGVGTKNDAIFNQIVTHPEVKKMNLLFTQSDGIRYVLNKDSLVIKGKSRQKIKLERYFEKEYRSKQK